MIPWSSLIVLGDDVGLGFNIGSKKTHKCQSLHSAIIWPLPNKNLNWNKRNYF